MVNIRETKTKDPWRVVSHQLRELQITAQSALRQRAKPTPRYGEKAFEPTLLSPIAHAFVDVLQAIPGVSLSEQVKENIGASLCLSRHAVRAHLTTIDDRQAGGIEVEISINPSPIIVIGRTGPGNSKVAVELVCGLRNTSIHEGTVLIGSREGLSTRYDGLIGFAPDGQVTDTSEAGWLEGPQGDLVWLGDHLSDRVDLARLMGRITSPDDLNQPLDLASLVGVLSR